jgi:two-component system CheB/CheR fusion protein
MINLIEEDIGRPIEHISTNIRESNLFAYILEVMKSGREIDREATLSDGRVTLMRILPYLRQDQSTDGVVVSFIDISGMKQRDNC